MADPQIDLVKIRNAELARRGLGAAQGISDFAAPVRDTLYSGIANPLAYLKDMSLAGLSGIYGAASDISGFGASALGAPELGKQLFSQADESYGSAMTRLKGALPGVPDISGFGPQDMQDIFSDENLGIPAFDVKMPATDRSGKVSSSAGALGSKVIPSNVQGGRGEDPRAQIAKDKTAIEELMGNKNNDAGAGIVQPSEVSKVPDAADELYKSSYEEYIKGVLTPDVAADPDSLEKYKQDFAKATGLDISGKPDTRSAAAAFGFALMQNRAGKGFNVGRMLESVGQAGAIAEGGGTVKFAYDRMNSIAKAIFPDLNVGKASSEQEYAQGVNLIMGRFKRFLTQETGNGISNKDVQIWENEIMKKPTWFTNFDETSSALDQLEDIFRSKLGEFDAGIDFIYDEGNLLPGDYEKLVEKYGDVSQIQGKAGKLVFQRWKNS
jgi:hypothetical protein